MTTALSSYTTSCDVTPADTSMSGNAPISSTTKYQHNANQALRYAALQRWRTANW
ncbi:hypothetical protein [Neoaquamicrobium sediminum]|uniref:Uncharacterized protein n=1 Tax=Neoaquamicrobium sediminum TaxID=1849104 RepID=A0ABV3X0F6_9HYPH|nr:hypothetical protein [Mesorhizobium sediminum]NRC56236.1 hypothetical protein [Mesorhizobium sediminum]